MMKIVVIGGTSGYGMGICEYMAAQGHQVIAAGRSSESHYVDVTDDYSVQRFFEKHGAGADLVVYSAGIAIGKDHVADKDLDDARRVFETNTIGLYTALQAAYPHLEQSAGIFIHIGSIANQLNYVGGADYCASKSAATTIMRTIRGEWLGSGIRTVSIEIGLGDTSFQKNRYAGDMEKAQKHTAGVRQIQPIDLGRFVEMITRIPEYINMDEVYLKPIDQVTHGFTINNKSKGF
jgi:NADP-dependent 3-hydroxy acid dehydrogenase YdfG